MQQTVTILLTTMPSSDQELKNAKLERAKKHSLTVYFRSPDTKAKLAALGKAEKRSAANWLRAYFLDDLEEIIEQRHRELEVRRRMKMGPQTELPAAGSGAGHSAAS